MKRENNNKNPAPEMIHNCGRRCLGPLTFHTWAVGDKIHLSEGCRRADRIGDTFKGGVVFSNRPVRICEKIQVLVQRKVPHWNGAMRVGFTNVPPTARTLPLPCMAMPNLTKTQGHWASPVPESCCQEGSVLEFWVSACGHLSVRFHRGRKQKLPIKVDLSWPLWAMIDVYGQTCSIFLLGSKKKEWLLERTSCPTPEPSPLTRHPCSFNPDYTALIETSCFGSENPADDDCVVCMGRKAEIVLPCGHRCLCSYCSSRVLEQFGTCPLCRLEINTPLVIGR